MSFASFAIGSNDVEATSTAASIAVFTSSATSTKVIASRSSISSSAVDAEADRGDEHRGREREVDPEVALRAEGVDDALGGVVEALEERRLRWRVRRHRLACARSRRSISSPWS